jgi:hypothetical protein
MRALVASDAASPLGTCSKLLSHGRVIYQISIFDASEKTDFFFGDKTKIASTVSGNGSRHHKPSICKLPHRQAFCAA